ncbi:hypothetical protein [Comamonas sediminis]|uniref:Uncharacterized protein n=1 Tax=Comamonas sediminis TaxID=1783360 RepID=A0ABV4B966_9BURK
MPTALRAGLHGMTWGPRPPSCKTTIQNSFIFFLKPAIAVSALAATSPNASHHRFGGSIMVPTKPQQRRVNTGRHHKDIPSVSIHGTSNIDSQCIDDTSFRWNHRTAEKISHLPPPKSLRTTLFTSLLPSAEIIIKN